MNTANLLALAAPSLLISLALSLNAAGQPASVPAAPATPAKTAAHATSEAAPRVLEVTVDTITSTDADAMDKAKAAAMTQRDAAGKQQGCIHSSVAAVAADPRGGSASVVRATVWETVENAESASLAADTGTSAARGTSSYFRLLRETKIGDGAAGHLEVVIFRTKPGVTREANLALFDKGESDYIELGKGDGGLLGHSLWIAPDGRWVHLLFWRSEADYQKTGKALFGKPGVGGWIRSLDFKRFTVYRGDIAGGSKNDAMPKTDHVPTK